MAKDDPVRFGAEFGPYRSSKSTGVSLSTFKTLVWTSNIGGLVLVAIGLELLVARNAFGWALLCFVAGVAVALFPSNYEIVGMGQPGEPSGEPADGEGLDDAEDAPSSSDGTRTESGDP